jgi:hypothetical protein
MGAVMEGVETGLDKMTEGGHEQKMAKHVSTQCDSNQARVLQLKTGVMVCLLFFYFYMNSLSIQMGVNPVTKQMRGSTQ